jgi:hypothetical protein
MTKKRFYRTFAEILTYNVNKKVEVIMISPSDRIKNWRRKTKRRIIDSFGGKCGICGYDKCDDSQDFHHLDPSEKEFSLGSVRASNRNWNSLVLELRKCVMLCCRCHREVHCGITKIPQNIARFNEDYANYKDIIFENEKDRCPVCGNNKSIYNKFCSSQCSGTKSWKIEWEKIDIISLIKEHRSFTKVGEIIGVNGTAVRKKIQRLGLIDMIYGNQKFICKQCGKEFLGNITDKRICCSCECSKLYKRKVIRPSKEELEKLIMEKSMVQIGKMFGVSDNAVRKWIKGYNTINKTEA